MRDFSLGNESISSSTPNCEINQVKSQGIKSDWKFSHCQRINDPIYCFDSIIFTWRFSEFSREFSLHGAKRAHVSLRNYGTALTRCIGASLVYVLRIASRSGRACSESGDEQLARTATINMRHDTWYRGSRARANTCFRPAKSQPTDWRRRNRLSFYSTFSLDLSPTWINIRPILTSFSYYALLPRTFVRVTRKRRLASSGKFASSLGNEVSPRDARSSPWKSANDPKRRAQ